MNEKIKYLKKDTNDMKRGPKNQPQNVANNEVIKAVGMIKAINFFFLVWKILLQMSDTYQSSFQMTVESNYLIAIAMLSDWIKRVSQLFKQ